MILVKDNEITLKDIDIAEKAYGPDIGSIKGKTTRRNKNESDNDMIEILEELISKNRYLEISVDTINVNELTLFTSIIHELYYRTAQHIPNIKSLTSQQCLEQLIRLYRKGDFYIKKIYCDNEFKKAFNTFKAEDYNIFIQYVAPQSHVSQAEWNNRTIKERIRSTFH